MTQGEEPRFDEREMASFDGGVCLRQRVFRPDRYRHIEALPVTAIRIVRGGGFSYAAAGFGGGGTTVDARALDRLLAFDPVQGVLECEAGTTLGTIHEVVSPAGWYLPVQPGHPAITVGGCLACDVHGKNPFRDATFRSTVQALRLFHPRHGHLLLDRENAPELLDLTCGGLGLTGHVLTVSLQLSRTPGPRVRLRRLPIRSLDMVGDMLQQEAATSDFAYSWHDLMQKGRGFGRGVLYAGRFVDEGPASFGQRRSRVDHMDSDGRPRRGWAVFNRPTTSVFNRVYGLVECLRSPEETIESFAALFPVARKTAYFRLFGRAGFHEYQMLVARESFAELMQRLRAYLSARPVAVTLSSCKFFGSRPRSLLRFDGGGLCLALNFPRNAAGAEFSGHLDGLVRDLGGIPNVFKDSRLPRKVAEDCYGLEICEFRRRLHEFDPLRLYRSDLSERLGL